jgi:hypothetical protein
MKTIIIEDVVLIGSTDREIDGQRITLLNCAESQSTSLRRQGNREECLLTGDCCCRE